MKNVLYFAENALSSIQGGGIVAYAVLKGLPAENLLGFYDYRNITPVPEYAERFVYLGQPWRTPPLFAAINRITRGATTALLHRTWPDRYIAGDLAFVEREVARRAFAPGAVYFAGLSYRYLRLAVMAAERYDVPMVVLHMDDWIQVDREQAERWGASWYRRTLAQLRNAAARSLVSTTNSPGLAQKLTRLTGYRHLPANNCCSDLMVSATHSAPARRRIPIITYAGAMNHHLQGETVRVLASAVSELNAEGTRVQLHIYTPWEFAPDANAIACPHAVFYKGQVGRERLADIYLRSDFLVTTTTYRERYLSLFRHSLSTKLSEYLCAGKPVISMGHREWHMHEYVQDHGCGFSILMDENFSRARIKEQIKRILATDATVLSRIGLNNRALWEQAHDVMVMARPSRRALGLGGIDGPAITSVPERRGALWLGGRASGYIPLVKLREIAKRLVDVFEQTAVDLVGEDGAHHPQLDALVEYCGDIGLEPTAVATPRTPDDRDDRWEPAGTRWSLDPVQRRVDASTTQPFDLFEQVAALRGTTNVATSPTGRVINQLTVRLAETPDRKPSVWFYGSAAIGLDMIKAIEGHHWLPHALTIGGFLSSPGHCASSSLHGYPWQPADTAASSADLIVVSSETSRLTIQEELTRLNLLDRMIPAYGMNADACVYERDPFGPGQAFVPGSTAADYATRELVARTVNERSPTTRPLTEERHTAEVAA